MCRLLRLARITDVTWKRVASVVGSLYLSAIPFWFSLRLLFFDRFWWLALLNTLAFYLFLPLAMILPVSLWYRQRRLVLGGLFCCLLFGFLFQPLFNLRTKLARPSHTQPSLTIMSFNLLWSNQDYAKVAQMIRTVQPDIIGLQEVKGDSIEVLAAALAPLYPHFVTHPVNRFHTVGILSRLPIATTTPLAYPPMERGLEVRIRNGTDDVRVIVVHLAPNNMPLWPPDTFITTTISRYAQRAAEIDYLQQRVQLQELPTVVLCDCNMTDTSETYATLHSILQDSFQERGWGLGHTLYVPGIPLPVQRVDYIWHTKEFDVIDAFVGPDGGSDHVPVVATMTYATR